MLTFVLPCYRFVLSIIGTFILIPKKNRFIFCHFLFYFGLFKIISLFSNNLGGGVV